VLGLVLAPTDAAVMNAQSVYETPVLKVSDLALAALITDAGL